MDSKSVVARWLSPQMDVQTLSSALKSAYPIDEVPCFGELLRAVDDAERKLRRARATFAAKKPTR